MWKIELNAQSWLNYLRWKKAAGASRAAKGQGAGAVWKDLSDGDSTVGRGFYQGAQLPPPSGPCLALQDPSGKYLAAFLHSARVRFIGNKIWSASRYGCGELRCSRTSGLLPPMRACFWASGAENPRRKQEEEQSQHETVSLSSSQHVQCYILKVSTFTFL
jgi:hypothetical protein